MLLLIFLRFFANEFYHSFPLTLERNGILARNNPRECLRKIFQLERTKTETRLSSIIGIKKDRIRLYYTRETVLAGMRDLIASSVYF